MVHQPHPNWAAVGSCVTLLVSPSDLAFSREAPLLPVTLRLEEEHPAASSAVRGDGLALNFADEDCGRGFL